jgi:hypothetical protein
MVVPTALSAAYELGRLGCQTVPGDGQEHIKFVSGRLCRDSDPVPDTTADQRAGPGRRHVRVRLGISGVRLAVEIPRHVISTWDTPGHKEGCSLRLSDNRRKAWSIYELRAGGIDLGAAGQAGRIARYQQGGDQYAGGRLHAFHPSITVTEDSISRSPDGGARMVPTLGIRRSALPTATSRVGRGDRRSDPSFWRGS